MAVGALWSTKSLQSQQASGCLDQTEERTSPHLGPDLWRLELYVMEVFVCVCVWRVYKCTAQARVSNQLCRGRDLHRLDLALTAPAREDWY